MFDFLSGTITTTTEKSVTLQVGAMGFNLNVPGARSLAPETQAMLYTYFHWNSENGPSLYGFQTQLDRKVFLLIIECPKIGPSIALNILSQINAGQFLEIIISGNHAALTSLNGIGNKKAEQIIVELKDKVQKLIHAGDLKIEQQQSFVQWQQLSDVLVSLNYTKQEASKAITHLADKHAGQNYPLDQLIRSALAYLSQKQV